MKRDQIVLLLRTTAVMVVLMLGGCSSLQQANETMIRVSASRNPAKAARLTWAGVKAFNVGAHEEALEKFSAAIAVDETYGPAHNNLGLLFYEEGDLYDAVLSFEAAMDYMPNDPSVYYNLGLALESAGKSQEAMDLYHQAVEMDPANPIFLGNLVRLRVRLGEHDPSLVAQLQDLILIETRPSWRRWADGQLALYFNDSLDRGPETPDFNTEMDRDRGDSPRRSKKVIDLTPESSPQMLGDDDELDEQTDAESEQNPLPPPPSQPRILSGPDMNLTPAEELPVPRIPPPPRDVLDLEDTQRAPEASDYFQ